MRILVSIFFCISLLAASPAPAMSSADREHAKNAFLFAERQSWDNALQHARRAQDRLLYKIIQWQYFRSKDSGAPFPDVTRFIRENPDWPEIDTLEQRAEETLVSGRFEDKDVAQWFAQHPPETGIGKLRLAEILMRTGGSEQEIRRLAKEGWKDADIDASLESSFKERFGNLLDTEDNIARADRLLWEEKTSAAERMLSRVPPARRQLFEARIALIKDARNAASLTERVPAFLQKDPGLLFNRMQWRNRRGLDDGVLEMLNSAPANVPYPKRWWKLREDAIRTALEKNNYTLALKIASQHSQIDGPELLEALWLRGWIALQYQHNAKSGYESFYQLYHAANYPVSKARGAYWAARAAEDNGNADIARSWFKQASRYPTTFYGQLALARLGKPLTLPPESEPSAQEKARFLQNDLPRAIQLLADARQDDLAHLFTLHMVERAKTVREVQLIADLSDVTREPENGVKSAKRASQKHNVTLIAHGYPRRSVSSSLPLEAALIHAIIRQESEFDARATSPSNAMGLMQLLPSTAREVARKLGMGFSQNRLFEPDYNMRIGSNYLRKLVDGFDGSYVMAVAGYNAGPSRVRGWLSERPKPKTLEGMIDWIERIPYSETRNYVQRVTENLQVYRYLMGQQSVSINQDLMR